MTRLTPIGISGRAYPALGPRPAPPAPLAARYPYVDTTREARIVQDVADLLHETPLSDETTRKIKRWIELVLLDAEERRRWWFLEAVAARWLHGGDDAIDVVGHVEMVVGVWAPGKLKLVPLPTLIGQRQARLAEGGPNVGTPSHYALEAGRRIHLWPAPSQRLPFAVLYARPMHVSLLPKNWDGIVLDGILGKFGRHFDRDALTQDPSAFEERYERRLQRASVATGHWDLEVLERWLVDYASQTGPSLAAAGGSTELRVPASLYGIGYQPLADGHYPLEVA